MREKVSIERPENIMNHSKDVIIIKQNANDWEPGRLENFVVRVEY